MFSDPFFFSCLSDGCHPVFNLHAGGLPAILAGGHSRFTLPRLEHLITCRRLPGSRAFRSSLWSEGKQAGTLCLAVRKISSDCANYIPRILERSRRIIKALLFI